MKRKTIEDLPGNDAFRLVWSVEDHWASVAVYYRTGEDESGAWIFDSNDTGAHGHSVTLLDQAKPYLEGYVKWDSCAELNIGCPHWCRPEQWVAHSILLKHIYHRAIELMGHKTENPWPKEAQK